MYYFIKAQATKLVDDSQPYFVLCEFYDVNERKHEIIEKWPVVTEKDWDGNLPTDCLIPCTVIEDGAFSYIINTDLPCSIESTLGKTVFEIRKDLLSQVSG